MCGIFGFAVKAGASATESRVSRSLEKLFLLSETRGKESAGLHAYLPVSGEAWTIKEAKSSSELIESQTFRRWTSGPFRNVFSSGGAAQIPLIVLAHSRLVTNGTSELPQNNQPVRYGQVTVIHNGIIVNADNLWLKHNEINRGAEVDTEVVAALLNQFVSRGVHPAEATIKTFSEIQGATSVAWVHDQLEFLILATNTGDLYFCNNKKLGFFAFASERYILRNALADVFSNEEFEIQWLRSGQGLFLKASTLSEVSFELKASLQFKSDSGEKTALRPVRHEYLTPERLAPLIVRSDKRPNESLLVYSENQIKNIKRCVRCILPETFPFIQFDQEGTCNYCLSYRPRYRGVDRESAKKDFYKKIEHYRNSNGHPDVLVPFSGGRDSSYGLHILKTEFQFTPITFTYDWGMVTDLARRNISRMCGKLGVQNILVSADIKQKRENIKKNVSAWLKSPDLGLVPLFMAGDKHFFSIVNQLKRQTGIRLDLWSANPLENTDFKSGFCGVQPDFEKHRLDYLSFSRKLKMVGYYARRFAQNPRYLNSSLWDTAGAFLSYYFEPRRDFYFMFNHLVWNEEAVNSLLLGEYDWELATDTESTWRIGDGTAPFYNYIYVTARGFSEFDSFRSNQIREGMLTREEALPLILKENRPRPESLKWYLDTVGLDFDETVRAINKLDVLRLHQ